jgi:hypothetical protein
MKPSSRVLAAYFFRPGYDILRFFRGDAALGYHRTCTVQEHRR